MTRWGPWDETVSLREAMDSLLQESVVRPRPGDAGGRSVPLALDIEERGDAFVVTAPIPGITPEEVELSVLGDTLRIRAERKEAHREEGENKRWLVREQRYGACERMVTLPCPVKPDQANAEFRDGILTITIPKVEEAKEKRIPVQAGQNQTQGQQHQEAQTVDTGKQEG